MILKNVTFDLKSQSIPATTGGGSFKGVFGDEDGSRSLLPSGTGVDLKSEEAERKIVNLSSKNYRYVQLRNFKFRCNDPYKNSRMMNAINVMIKDEQI